MASGRFRVRLRAIAIVATLSLVGLLGLEPSAGAVTSFAQGDVFAAVSSGQVQWRHADGSLVQTLDDGQGGFTTGMAFDKLGKLYVTNFSGGFIDVYDSTGTLTGDFGPGGWAAPESIVFDGAGNAYVGQANADQIVKLSSTGAVLTTLTVATEARGTDWIDLASDQCTIYYTSEGSSIKRFNACTNTQLADFATGLPGSAAYALRILSDGGVLVADSSAVLRLNASGSVVKTYDAAGEDSWFALNLDPDGTSFWSADFSSANAYRFNLSTGSQLSTFNTGTGFNTLFGLAIKGELTAGRDTAPPTCRVSARRPGPPAQIDITFQDTGSGLASIVTKSALNATVSIPAFSPATKNPVVVTATKTNQSQISRVGLEARDVAGNVTRCTASGVIPF